MTRDARIYDDKTSSIRVGVEDAFSESAMSPVPEGALSKLDASLAKAIELAEELLKRTSLIADDLFGAQPMATGTKDRGSAGCGRLTATNDTALNLIDRLGQLHEQVRRFARLN